MKQCSLLLTLLISVSLSGQVRIIPHLSKTAGGFTPGLIIGNFENSASNFSFTPYNQDGTAMTKVQGSIAGDETGYYTLSEIFGTDNVSHFTISADDSIRVSTTYESTSGDGSPAHVHESCTQSLLWRVYPGDWDVIWDGMAVVNTGTDSTDVVITQKSETGTTIKSITAISDLGVFAKGLIVFGSAFSKVEHSHFEITADQPIAITSLRGSNNNTFLWENAAISSAAPDSFKSVFTEFRHLNHNSVDVALDWVEIPATVDPCQFDKHRSDTHIEVYLNSSVYSGAFHDSPYAILYQIRVDGKEASIGAAASIRTPGTFEWVSLFSVFKNLSEGPHIVSIWVKCVSSGNVTGTALDLGGLDGKIIVKETF